MNTMNDTFSILRMLLVASFISIVLVEVNGTLECGVTCDIDVGVLDPNVTIYNGTISCQEYLDTMTDFENIVCSASLDFGSGIITDSNTILYKTM
jgi:hypothetical protein